MKTVFKRMLGILLFVCLFGAYGMQESPVSVRAATADALTKSGTEEFVEYQEGVEYAGDDRMFSLSLDTAYKGHKAVPLDFFTDYFIVYGVQGEKLDHNALVSFSNTEKGNVMVLKFVHPIDATKFNKLNLRVYINNQVDILTYNADDVTVGSLGTALESFTVGGGQLFYLNLTSSLYVNDQNEVETIVFQFLEDCKEQVDGNGEIIYDQNDNVIRDTFHFVSFNVEKEENDDIVFDDSFLTVSKDDAYEISFRFNKTGALNGDVELDTDKILLNGVTLSKILSDCKDASASWYSVKGIYQINLHLPKTYAGEGRIINTEYSFAGNYMTVMKGLRLPNGETLEKTYTCHLYSGENMADCELTSEYKPTKVENVRFSYDAGSNNLRFTLYFDKEITSVPYYHGNQLEIWRESELTKFEGLYDGGITKIFIDGGYKSALLDDIVINGWTIGEWHARYSKALDNIQIHYGNTALNTVDIIFASAQTETYSKIYDILQTGKNVTIEVKAGLKFMVNTEVKQTQVFNLTDNSFIEQIKATPIHVYFNGAEIGNGDTVKANTEVSAKSLAVEGVEDYLVAYVKKGNVTQYTISYGYEKEFKFTVETNVTVETAKKGCGSQINGGFVGIPLAFAVGALTLLKRREKYEKKRND